MWRDAAIGALLTSALLVPLIDATHCAHDKYQLIDGEKDLEDNWVVFAHSGDESGLTKLSPWDNNNLQNECGMRTYTASPFKIAGGQRVAPGQFPWVVGIAQESDKNWFLTHCTGTIIGPRHVLTAAHCVYQGVSAFPCPAEKAQPKPLWYNKNDPNRSMTVVYGSVCQKENSDDQCGPVNRRKIRKRVVKIATTLAFLGNRCVCGDDIAVLEVDEPFEWNPLTQPICLGRVDTSGLSGINSDIPIRAYLDQLDPANTYDVGWGRTDEREYNGDEGTTVPPHLRYIYSTIADMLHPGGHDVVSYPRYDAVKSGICKGDSGGPLLAKLKHDNRFVLVGVHSWSQGDACLDKDRLKYYASANAFVPPYVDVICELTGICASNQ